MREWRLQVSLFLYNPSHSASGSYASNARVGSALLRLATAPTAAYLPFNLWPDILANLTAIENPQTVRYH